MRSASSRPAWTFWSQRTGLRADEVASMLLILELEGRIESYPGGLYVRRVLKAAK